MPGMVVQRLTTGSSPGEGRRMCPLLSRGCLLQPEWTCVCVEPRSGSVTRHEGLRRASEFSVSGVQSRERETDLC